MSLPNVEVFAYAGTAAYDIASYAFEVRVDRGRGRELDPPSAGIAEVYLRNADGMFNPGNTGGTLSPVSGTATLSPAAGALAPGNKLLVQCDNGTLVGSSLFFGRIRSADYSYDVSGDAVVRVVAEDAMAGLARRTLTGRSHDTLTFGSAVWSVLDNVVFYDEISVWPASSLAPFLPLLVASGVTTIAPYGTAESEGANALEYLSALEASEQGRIFCTRQGYLTADGRYAAASGRTVGTAVVFTDDPTPSSPYAVPYQTITGRSGGDVLYTRIIGYSPSSQSWRSVTAAGTATYGLTSDLSMSNLRNANDDLTEGVLGFLADVYDSPEWRVDEISCRPFAALAAGTALSFLLNTDLNDTVTVEFTPTAGSAVNAEYRVQGVRHTITPGDHVMALNLSVKTFDRDDLIVLDTSTLGTAGTDVLGF